MGKRHRKDLKLLVIALGGNALNSPDDSGSFEEQEKNAQNTAKLLAGLIRGGYRIVISHGNGPQVGNILLQQEYAKNYVSPMPLAVCGAQSQGQIGTALVRALNNEFLTLNLNKQAVSIVTHVLVDEKDSAFTSPKKPIGPIYTLKEAKKLKKQGFYLKEVVTGAWRRVVSSPKPLKILEIEAIKDLLEMNFVPIAVGGGGIPVIKKGRTIKLIDAVIDKDLASQALANAIGAKILIILTNVKQVALNFQKRNQRLLSTISLEEAKKYLSEGHFSAGSMEPKIKAATQFLESGGETAIIAHLADLIEALSGKSGTIITKTIK